MEWGWGYGGIVLWGFMGYGVSVEFWLWVCVVVCLGWLRLEVGEKYLKVFFILVRCYVRLFRSWLSICVII